MAEEENEMAPTIEVDLYTEVYLSPPSINQSINQFPLFLLEYDGKSSERPFLQTYRTRHRLWYFGRKMDDEATDELARPEYRIFEAGAGIYC